MWAHIVFTFVLAWLHFPTATNSQGISSVATVSQEVLCDFYSTYPNISYALFRLSTNGSVDVNGIANVISTLRVAPDVAIDMWIDTFVVKSAKKAKKQVTSAVKELKRQMTNAGISSQFGALRLYLNATTSNSNQTKKETKMTQKYINNVAKAIVKQNFRCGVMSNPSNWSVMTGNSSSYDKKTYVKGCTAMWLDAGAEAANEFLHFGPWPIVNFRLYASPTALSDFIQWLIYLRGSTKFIPNFNTTLCSDGWTKFRGNCYKTIMTLNGQTGSTLLGQCKKAHVNGTVVSIHDDDENRFVQSLSQNASLSNSYNVLIGTRLSWAYKCNSIFGFCTIFITGYTALYVTSAYNTDGTTMDYGNPFNYPWTTRGTYPWSHKQIYPAQPDGQGRFADCTMMWLNISGVPFGQWDDTTCGAIFSGVVCKITYNDTSSFIAPTTTTQSTTTSTTPSTTTTSTTTTSTTTTTTTTTSTTTTTTTTTTTPCYGIETVLGCQSCPIGWTAYNNNCYIAILGTINCTTAAVNATIMSIHNVTDNKFFYSLASNATPTATYFYVPFHINWYYTYGFFGWGIFHFIHQRIITGYYWEDGSTVNFGAPALNSGAYPWRYATTGYAAQPDGYNPPAGCTLMWLPSSGQPQALWEDYNCGEIATTGTVCRMN